MDKRNYILHVKKDVQCTLDDNAQCKCHDLPVNLFLCVEVLWPSQHNGVMSRVVSLPIHVYWAGLVL